MDNLLQTQAGETPGVRSPRFGAQEGSAYIVVLMVLLVLTIVGLSVSVTTQTESMLGAQERQIQRIFYAADSGVGVATARVLVSNDRRSQTFSVVETRQMQGQDVFDISEDIDMSPFVPIRTSPCDLCQINQGSEFYEINHAVGILATRRGIPTSGGPAVPMGRDELSVMIEIQPWKVNAESVFIEDPAELKKIKF